MYIAYLEAELEGKKLLIEKLQYQLDKYRSVCQPMNTMVIQRERLRKRFAISGETSHSITAMPVTQQFPKPSG